MSTTTVTINGTPIDITGAPGALSIGEDVIFFGEDSFSITSQADFVAFVKAIAPQAKIAWPSVSLSISTSTSASLEDPSR